MHSSASLACSYLPTYLPACLPTSVVLEWARLRKDNNHLLRSSRNEETTWLLE
ncbi:hypothetical protein BDW42DRAFT_173735 [Aspergillus taichungensis]|uniref:Uncharacterized protein n=1 Tax=Aspergillus taichungensis TaxID=482145 RepID=A0A2J5HPE2_9EURO|nr:hypothetical protein BDW42DRAFT_173735 [Aspergillus taichungensis]